MKTATSFSLGVDPKIRAPGAKPIEIARRSLAWISPFVRANHEPKPKALALSRGGRHRGRLHNLQRRRTERDVGWQLIRRHERDGVRRQQTHPVQFAAVQQHLTEPGVIGGRRLHAPAPPDGQLDWLVASPTGGRLFVAGSTCGSATRPAFSAGTMKSVSESPTGLMMRSSMN